MRSVCSYNKRDELYMHIIEHKYDIVGLSKTWANDNISDSELNIAWYSLYRKDWTNKFKSKGEELPCIYIYIYIYFFFF